MKTKLTNEYAIKEIFLDACENDDYSRLLAFLAKGLIAQSNDNCYKV